MRDPSEVVRSVDQRLFAPCCWRESVGVHESEIASQIRTEIRSLAREGRSEDDIVRIYAAKYGPRIVRVPADDWSFLGP